MLHRVCVLLGFSAIVLLVPSGLFADTCPPTPSLPPECFYGLCLGPYLNDPYQEPGQPGRPPLPPEQIEDRVATVTPFARWLRTYSVSDGQDWAPPYARALGVQTLIGTWIMDYGGGEDVNEVRRAFGIASCGDANLPGDIVVVGNEEVFSGRKYANGMRDYIRDVAKPIRTELQKECIPIGIAEPWYTLFDESGAPRYPTLLEEIDGPVLVNIFPFHEGVSIDGAFEALRDTYRKIRDHPDNNGRDIWIGETGWPSEGGSVGDAVASCENAARYLRECVDWTASEDVPLCYFDAYDEDWKAYDQYGNARAPAFEAHWGVWYNDGVLKIPEPASGLLLGFGGALLAGTRRRGRALIRSTMAACR